MSINQITFAVSLFDGPEDIRRSRRALLLFMEALTSINLGYLHEHPETPALYESGVVYQPERGTEIWKDIPNVLRDGFGDCEDLATWRCAEYRAMGIHARPWIKWSDQTTVQMYHALLQLPSGQVEDPSLALGMGGAPIVARSVFVRPT